MPRFVAGLPLTGAEGAESAETVFNAETAEPAESFSTFSARFVGSALVNKSSVFFAGSALNPASAGSYPRSILDAAYVSAERARERRAVFNAETAEPAESFNTVSAHFVGSALINKPSAFFAGSALSLSSAPR
jgi:hypothetical protein